MSVQAAYTLLRLDRPKEALELLAKDFDVGDPFAWHVRGMALIALDRFADAEVAFRRGLQVDPENEFLLDSLAAARIARNDLAGAEEAILAALQIDANDADLLARYAHVVASAGQIDKAEKLIARALANDPENDYALRMHALLATARADHRATIDRSLELLRRAPESTTGHRLLGAAHAERGRVDDAAAHLLEAARLDPADHDLIEAAREARVSTHWAMWPLRPIERYGPGPVWIAGVAMILLLRFLKNPTALTVGVIAWVTYCVYSWVVPPIVRRRMRRF